jgi:uncharacterized protein YcbX
MLKVSGLFIYPVKSLAGIALKSAEVTDRGLKYDRRWMLVDDTNRFISQREVPLMALLIPQLLPNGLTISYPAGKTQLVVPLKPISGETVSVTIWDDTCTAWLVSREANDWFSKILGINCRLVYMPDYTHRMVDPDYTATKKINSFSDGYPNLLIGQASIDDLSRRVGQSIPINRFRPNIVFTGGAPYAEDELAEFTIGCITFYGVKICARCPIPGIDQETAMSGKEPIKTLAGYRRKNKKIYMGQNLVHTGTGIINVGDPILVRVTKVAERFD